MPLKLTASVLLSIVVGLVSTTQTLRDMLFFIAGVAALALYRHRFILAARSGGSRERGGTALRDEFLVSTLTQLRETIPAGLSGSCATDAPKVLDHLDEQMIRFVQRAPFLQLATADANGQPFVSPKGDAPGFVRVVEHEPNRGVALRIPDRPGNQLIFGWQNLLQGTGRVGLCLVIPGCETTLRCGGTALLTRDPALLDEHAARGLPATIVLHVGIEYAFFHCAKAYLRSRLWEPQSWPAEKHRVKFGPYFHRNAARSDALDDAIDEHYRRVQRAVAGECNEPG